MIIEFIGAPGAGKTTLLPTVIECLRLRDIRAFTVVDGARPVARRTLVGRMVARLAPAALRDALLWRVFLYGSLVHRLGFMLRHPRLVGGVLWSQWRRPAAAHVRERQVLHWFFRLVGYYAFLRTHLRRDEALVLDEGFVHRVVQLHASGVEILNIEQITNYVGRLPKPDLVIHADVPAAVAEERIYRRGLWARWQGKDRAEISRFVCNAHAAVDHAVAHMAHSGWPVLSIDNSQPDPALAQEALRRNLAEIPWEAIPLSTWKQSLSNLEAQP